MTTLPFVRLGWRVTSYYGLRIHPTRGDVRHHRGVDLVKEHRHPIPAFVSGKVVFSGDGDGHAGFWAEQGIAVAVQDDHGYLHCYLHLDEAVSAVGDTVVAGLDIIGRQGNTGTLSTGSHLHYEVRHLRDPSRPSASSWAWDRDVCPGTYVTHWQESRQEPSDWAREEWAWATAAGYVNGKDPRRPMTREEFAVALQRFAEEQEAALTQRLERLTRNLAHRSFPT